MTTLETNLHSGEETNLNNLHEDNTIIEKYETFDEMNLREEILRGIYAHGFDKPSPIQKIAIDPIIKRRDMIAQAQSGTGKTGAFTVGSLQIIDFNLLEPQVIVIAPTRELAMQINTVFNQLGSYCNIKTVTCIGGINARIDEDAFKEGRHVVVGCPGRIYHMINKGLFKLKHIKQLVIDEADVMLEKGFKEQLYEIFNLGFPQEMKIALFSATLTKDTYTIANQFMKNHVNISVKKEDVNLSGIQQYKIGLIKDEHKFPTLIDLYKFISIKQAIIYCNNKNRVITLAAELNDLKLSMSFVHGDMEQVERNKILSEFRQGMYRILISTDLLARGIDIQQVELVINYDIPLNKENYMHRIGRSGRFGRKGIALNFVTDRDDNQLKDIEAEYNLEISELPSDVSNIFNV
jgi:translation initiation factor 4A